MWKASACKQLRAPRRRNSKVLVLSTALNWGCMFQTAGSVGLLEGTPMKQVTVKLFWLYINVSFVIVAKNFRKKKMLYENKLHYFCHQPGRWRRLSLKPYRGFLKTWVFYVYRPLLQRGTDLFWCITVLTYIFFFSFGLILWGLAHTSVTTWFLTGLECSQIKLQSACKMLCRHSLWCVPEPDVALSSIRNVE